MKSDVIYIDNHGNGFEKVIKEVHKVATYMELDSKESMHVQLCAEEVLSLARSITGEMKASFWIECQPQCLDLHLSTKTIMDQEKRFLLISSATSRKNEAANTLLGRLRDIFEQAMVNEADYSDNIPLDVLQDVAYHPKDQSEWDGYERSVLRSVADEVKVYVRGDKVDLTVVKKLHS